MATRRNKIKYTTEEQGYIDSVAQILLKFIPTDSVLNYVIKPYVHVEFQPRLACKRAMHKVLGQLWEFLEAQANEKDNGYSVSEAVDDIEMVCWCSECVRCDFQYDQDGQYRFNDPAIENRRSRKCLCRLTRPCLGCELQFMILDHDWIQIRLLKDGWKFCNKCWDLLYEEFRYPVLSQGQDVTALVQQLKTIQKKRKL